MSDKLQKLLDIADPADRAELELLAEALEKTGAAYRAGYRAADKRDWDAAREGLSEAVERLWARYFIREKVYKNRLAVLEHLQDLGYKVGKTKIYQDADAGLLRLQPDGSVLQSAVEAYLHHPAARLVRPAQAADEAEAEEMGREKISEELKHLRLKNEKLQFDFDKDRGRYLPRDEFELELAGRAAVLDSGLKHRFSSRAAQWIATVAGNQEKRAELVALLHGALDEALTDFATTDTFQVMIIEDADADAEFDQP